ncbi:MAG: hypothetical protein ACYSVY_00085 [Planctomycetota bacterium]|jgi:hypothetical protein
MFVIKWVCNNCGAGYAFTVTQEEGEKCGLCEEGVLQSAGKTRPVQDERETRAAPNREVRPL